MISIQEIMKKILTKTMNQDTKSIIQEIQTIPELVLKSFKKHFKDSKLFQSIAVRILTILTKK